MTAQLPLAGIRILDMGQFWAGPNAGRHWGDAGADVIKIESCRRPDPLRIQARGIYPDRDPDGAKGDHWNRSGMINERNRNKRSLAIDLASDRGRQIFLDLVRHADVVSQNYSSRVMPSLGLAYETLSEINPRLIMISIMSQGLTGPESQYVSYGQNLEQLSGISYFSGYPDDEDSSVGFALPDPLGGAAAAFAVAAALRHRERTGRGMHIDLSQRETASLVVGDALVEYSLGGHPVRLGNHEPGASPSECYPTAGEDRWVAISIRSDGDRVRMAEAMGSPELATDARFASIIGRRRHRAELDAAIEGWTRQQDHREAMALLQQSGIAAAAVLNPRELFQDPHLRARGFWEATSDYSSGEQEYTGRPMRLSATPYGGRTPTPGLGQHNREILGELLDLDDAELDALEADGVIGAEPILSASGGMAVAR